MFNEPEFWEDEDDITDTQIGHAEDLADFDLEEEIVKEEDSKNFIPAPGFAEALNFDDLSEVDAKKLLDKLLAKFIFGCNITFRTISSKFLLDIVKAVNKCPFEYKPPCRQTVAGSLLNSFYKDVEQRKKRCLKTLTVF